MGILSFKDENVLTGKKMQYIVIDEVISKGENGSLYKVAPLSNKKEIFMAKFYTKRDIDEYTNVVGLGTNEQRAFKRFKKEPKFLNLFDHKNIVKYIDEYNDMNTGGSSQCFYIMEYFSGKTINEYILQQTIPNKLTEIVLGITSAIVEIHSKDVIHRDIHPGNIFINNGEPKLIDFGCSVGGGVTKPHDYFGERTELAGFFHRAPEVLNPSKANFKSDIFALGITLLELLNLNMPSIEERYDRKNWIKFNLNKLKKCKKLKNLLERMVKHDSSIRPSSLEVYTVLSNNKDWIESIGQYFQKPRYRCNWCGYWFV